MSQGNAGWCQDGLVAGGVVTLRNQAPQPRGRRSQKLNCRRRAPPIVRRIGHLSGCYLPTLFVGISLQLTEKAGVIEAKTLGFPKRLNASVKAPFYTVLLA